MVAALALAVSLAAPAGFTYGVAAGEVTPTSALLWTRAPRAGAVRLEAATDARFRRVVARGVVRATVAADLTVRVRATRLKARTRYWYRFRSGRVTSAVGRFVTAPSPGTAATIRFAISGDADASRAPGQSKPFFNNFETYGAMAAERNDFNVNLGDTIYSDSEIGGSPPALTLAAKRAKYRTNLAQPALRRLRAATGVYSHWDDHEFVNDFSRPEFGDELYAAGVRAFTEYAPVTFTQTDGLYRTFRWGKNVELFFLDERSFRSAKASAGGVCNDARGQPDLAPTSPQPVRNAFAQLAPPLAQPVSQRCLETINDPNRTMLGAHQLERFEQDVAASTATFKVIVNEVPIQQFYALPYDRWEGYAAERTKLLTFLHDNVKNVVFLTTDTHAVFVNDVRFRTLEPGGPAPSGILEAVVGPVATNTFAKEIDNSLGSRGAGLLVTGLFFKPQPPGGVGMQCANPDVYSYGEVTVTATTLTIQPKDSAGKAVADVTGAPCGPFVLTAR